MCQNTVLNNENLELDFRLLVASLVTFKSDSDLEIVDGLFQALVSKLANTCINEFMNARIERELKDQGTCKVVDADEILRPCLRTFAPIVSAHPYCAQNLHATSCIERAR